MDKHWKKKKNVCVYIQTAINKLNHFVYANGKLVIDSVKVGNE